MQIIETKKIELKSPVLIEGFPGVGMIGTSALIFLTRTLKMEMCGYVMSEKFPPFCTIHEGIPLPPARIYASREYNLLAVFSEFIIPLGAAHELCSVMIDWARAKGVRRIYSLGGINIKVPEEEIDKVFGIATTDDTRELLEQHGITVIKEGVTTGVTGILLAQSYVRGFPAIALLTPSRAIAIDLRSAAAVLEKLAEIEQIGISTQQLIEEGKAIEQRIADVLKRAKEARKRYEKMHEIPTMYR